MKKLMVLLVMALAACGGEPETHGGDPAGQEIEPRADTAAVDVTGKNGPRTGG
jgi:hypothetical protein